MTECGAAGPTWGRRCTKKAGHIGWHVHTFTHRDGVSHTWWEWPNADRDHAVPCRHDKCHLPTFNLNARCDLHPRAERVASW